MEFCSGGSVADIMQFCKRTFQEKEIGAICYCVLKALSYLHSKNVCHRDIKGGNILLTQSGVAKLTDFGVSKIADKGKKMNTVVGSPYWMAPELISVGNYDVSADIWSLGVTCIEMAEGNPPHHDMHPMRAMRVIPTSEPPTLKVDNNKKWSKELTTLLSICLKKKPEERPPAKLLLKNPFVKNSKKMFKKELKALVTDTISTMTQEKRKTIAKAQEESQKTVSQILNNSGFISLNAQKGSARTFTEAEGKQMFNVDTEDAGTMVIHGGSGAGTVVVKDTEADAGEDKLGVAGGNTVIIKEDPNSNSGTVVIKN